jgi:hypothetical protein
MSISTRKRRLLSTSPATVPCGHLTSRLSHGHVGVVAILNMDEKAKRAKEVAVATDKGGKAGEPSQGPRLAAFQASLFSSKVRRVQWDCYCIWILTRSHPCINLARLSHEGARLKHLITMHRKSPTLQAIPRHSNEPTPCSGRLLGTCTRYLEPQ